MKLARYSAFSSTLSAARAVKGRMVSSAAKLLWRHLTEDLSIGLD